MLCFSRVDLILWGYTFIPQSLDMREPCSARRTVPLAPVRKSTRAPFTLGCRPVCSCPQLPSCLTRPALLCPRRSPCRAWASASSSWWHPWLLIVGGCPRKKCFKKTKQKKVNERTGASDPHRTPSWSASSLGLQSVQYVVRLGSYWIPNTFLETTAAVFQRGTYLFIGSLRWFALERHLTAYVTKHGVLTSAGPSPSHQDVHPSYQHPPSDIQEVKCQEVVAPLMGVYLGETYW